MLIILKIIAIIPFGYVIVSRVRKFQDVIHLVVTQFVPGVFLTYKLGNSSLALSGAGYFSGYIAFLSIYEVGYLANDAWDAKSKDGGRLRLPFTVDIMFLIPFFTIRLVTWYLLTVKWQPIGDLKWIVMSLTLAVVFALHNLVKNDSFRIATFVQLTILRFCMPIFFAIGVKSASQIMMLSSIVYLHFRSLAYLDSKKLLIMPVRKEKKFGIIEIVLFFPILSLLSYIESESMYLELWLYFVSLYSAYLIKSKKSVG